MENYFLFNKGEIPCFNRVTTCHGGNSIILLIYINMRIIYFNSSFIPCMFITLIYTEPNKSSQNAW